MTSPGYNANHPSVKRILREAREFQTDNDSDIIAEPLHDELFEWHFTMRGAPDSEFEGGIYHGRILLPMEYPLKPPDIIMLTPSGRFKPGKKICLSNSSYHPENWQPAWSIRTALVALRGFMPTEANGAVGSMNLSKERRIELAKNSIDWKCESCKSCNRTALPELELKEEPVEQEKSTPLSDDDHSIAENKEQQTRSIDIAAEMTIEDPQTKPEIRQRFNEETPNVPQQEQQQARPNIIPPAVAPLIEERAQPRVVQVSPVKLNIFLGFLLSFLAFLLARRFLF